MRQIVIINVLFFLIMGCLTAGADEAMETVPSSELYLELGGRTDPDALVGEVGLGFRSSPYTAWRGGLAFLAADELDDYYVGITGGVRFSVDAPVMPFIGFGVFGGYSNEYRDADTDGYDNNDDGFIDEFGEEEDVITGMLASVYPEIGIQLRLYDNTLLTVSGKYYVTTAGRDTDFWIYSVGLTFNLD